MKKSIIAFSCLAILFGSCKKDKDDNNQITTENIAGTYTLGSVTIKAGAAPEQDYTNDWYEACEKDDKIVLNLNGSAVYTDAGVKCDPAGDDSGTWALTTNNTKISIDDMGELTIVSFDGRVLKIGETDSSSGTTITYTITLNKQ
ncbi:MAG: lipocalin family protein [Chitinophagaceae bacterium]